MRSVLLVLAVAGAGSLGWVWFVNVPAPGARRAAPLLSPSDPPAAAAPVAAPAGPTDSAPALPRSTPLRLPNFGSFSPAPRRDAPPPAPAFVDSRPSPEPPSEMDQLRRKAEQWRARYAPVAQQIAALEDEIRRLEEEKSRTLEDKTRHFDGPRDPNIRTGAERTLARLPEAESELKRLRRTLAQIEDDARRDGVPSGQLY